MSGKPSLALQGIGDRISSIEKPNYRLGEVRQINLESIDVHPQVRRPITKESIKGLAAVIEREKQRLPVEVYHKDNRFVLVSGERRYRALEYLEHKTIEVKIVAEPSDADLVYLQLTENTEHEPLSVIEIAVAVSRLFNMGETGQRIANNLNLGGRDKASRYKRIGEASKQVHDLYYAHGITDQRTLYVAAQIESDWPHKFESLYDKIAAKEIGRDELSQWLTTLRNNRDSAEGGKSQEGLDDKGQPESLGEAQGLEDHAKEAQEPSGDAIPEDQRQHDPTATQEQAEERMGAQKPLEDGNDDQGFQQEAGVHHSFENAKPEEAGNDEQGDKKVTVGDNPVAIHYAKTGTVALPEKVCIVVKGKLPDGKKITGTLMLDRVDNDSNWAWVQPDEPDEPAVKFEVKRLKMVSFTA